MKPAGSERIVARCHDALLCLCDELEELADSLPRDRVRCLTMASGVHKLVASSHAIEETNLFGPLASLRRRLPELEATLSRLRSEHHADLCFAEEISDALLAFGRGEEDFMTADALGYMLRAFFECVRRHVAFEREILVPLLALVQYPVNHNAS